MVDMETPPSIANDAADNTTTPRNRDENSEDASSINAGYYFFWFLLFPLGFQETKKGGIYVWPWIICFFSICKENKPNYWIELLN